MANIDNTTFFYILQQISGKEEAGIKDDLLLFEENLRSRIVNGKDKTVFWPTKKTWRGENNYSTGFDVLDKKAENQVFHERNYVKGEYCFASHAYDVLLKYLEGSFSSDNALNDAKKQICICLNDFYVDSKYCDNVQSQSSLADIAYYIVSEAIAAKQYPDKQTQLSKLDTLRKTTPAKKVKGKSRKLPDRKFIIGLIGVVASLALIAGAIVLIAGKESPSLDKAATYDITLYAPGDMSVDAYNASVAAIHERLDIMADGQDYVFEKAEDSISLIMPKAIFKEELPEDVLRNYIATPTQLYLLDVENFDIFDFSTAQYIKIARDDSEEVVAHTGTIEGVVASEYGIETESYPYIELTLTQECAAEITETTASWDSKVVAQDITANAFSYWNTFFSADNRSVYLLDQAGFAAVAVHNYSTKPLPTAFDIDVKHEVEWEKTETAFYRGAAQCDVSDLEGGAVEILFGSYIKEKNSGDWVETEVEFKNRLDLLGQPYAYGTIIKEEGICPVVRTSPDRMGAPIASLLTANSSDFKFVCGLNSESFDKYYTESEIVANEDSGIAYRLAISKPEWQEPVNLQELTTGSTGELTLCVNGLPLLSISPYSQTRSTNLEYPLEEKEISFSHFYFNHHEPISSSNQWILELLDEVLFSDYYVSFYLSEFSFCADENGTLPDVDSFGVHYKEDEEKVFGFLSQFDFAASPVLPGP